MLCIQATEGTHTCFVPPLFHSMLWELPLVFAWRKSLGPMRASLVLNGSLGISWLLGRRVCSPLPTTYPLSPFSIDELPARFDLTSTLDISQFYKDVLHFRLCTKPTHGSTSLPQDRGVFAETINSPRQFQPAHCIKGTLSYEGTLCCKLVKIAKCNYW